MPSVDRGIEIRSPLSPRECADRIRTLSPGRVDRRTVDDARPSRGDVRPDLFGPGDLVHAVVRGDRVHLFTSGRMGLPTWVRGSISPAPGGSRFRGDVRSATVAVVVVGAALVAAAWAVSRPTVSPAVLIVLGLGVAAVVSRAIRRARGPGATESPRHRIQRWLETVLESDPTR